MSKEVILCVDDEQIVLNSLNAQLKRKFGDSYIYEFAESPEEAFEIIDELSNDGYTIVMVISDQIMPGMTGDQFLVSIHKKHPRPIKLLLTGQAGLESAINAVNNANLYRYLVKPWNEDDFLLTVEKGLKEYYLLVRLEEQCANLQTMNKELQSLSRANARFVPDEFIHTLGHTSISQVELGDQTEGNMTVLFSDIRSYTTLSEGMTPRENFNFINGYLRRVMPVITGHNGFVNQFLGDGIMAIYPRSPDDAVRSSIEMHKALVEYNSERIQKKRLPIQIGIGLHTGYLMLGIIGSPQRLDASILSDTVNTASRLEGVTKQYGATIIISDSTLAGLTEPEQYQIRFLGRFIVKGKNKPIGIYEILDSEPEAVAELKLKTLQEFNLGLEYYTAGRFAEALVAFNQVLSQNPTDKAAKNYVEKAASFVVQAPVDWQGVEVLTSK